MGLALNPSAITYLPSVLCPLCAVVRVGGLCGLSRLLSSLCCFQGPAVLGHTSSFQGLCDIREYSRDIRNTLALQSLPITNRASVGSRMYHVACTL